MVIDVSVISGKALRCLVGQIIQIISPLSIPMWHLFDSSFSFCGYFSFPVKKTKKTKKKAVCTIPLSISASSIPLLGSDFLSTFKKLVFTIPQKFGFCVKLRELK